LKPVVLLVCTFDTKGAEAAFIKSKIENWGVSCVTMDAGTGGMPVGTPDISLDELTRGSEYTSESIRAMKRGEAVECVSKLVEAYVMGMYRAGSIDCAAGIGGAGGTQIVTQMLRNLPFGFPKFVLSTLASGNTRWYLKASDIVLIPSISDVAGLNCVTKLVFDRFAAVCASAAAWYSKYGREELKAFQNKEKRRISMTMYGTTTKGVTRMREQLERDGFETIVFHASGAGGQSMEKFIEDGVIDGVLDSTLAEIGAYFTGGLHDAGEHRLEAAAKMGIPQLIVPGGADTVVLPPIANVPEKFRNRTLNFHNPTMTTMRTDVEENIKIGNFMADKLKNAKGPVKILVPLGGLSSIDRPGLIFYCPEATDALIATLKEGLKGTAVELLFDKRHIDDPGFGEYAASLLNEMMKEFYK